MYPKKYLNREDTNAVYFSTLPFECSNNWSAHAIELHGTVFPTVDHAYHYHKFVDVAEEVAEKILQARSPWQATKLAQENQEYMRPDWEHVKVEVMTSAIQAKYEQHDDVKAALERTGNRTIYEVLLHNTFWGINENGDGENLDGKIWMKIRDGK